MVSDFLTKGMKVGGDVWDISRHGTWNDGDFSLNMVTMNGLEFVLSNPTTTEDKNMCANQEFD